MSASRYALIIAATIASISGCGAPPAINHQTAGRFDSVVARADTFYTITLAQLYAELDHSQMLPLGGQLTVSQVADELDRILVDTLSSLIADTIDLADYYDYNRLYRMRYYDYLIRRFGQIEIYQKIPVDSQEIVDYYEENIDQFSRGEEVYVWHILATEIGLQHGPDSLRYRAMGGDSLKVETERYVREVRRVLDEGRPFKEVAKEYSHDNMVRARGGALGWVGKGRYEDPFDSVAFLLKPGEYSAPYRTDNGWHIIYVEDYRPAETAPLDDRLWRHVENSIRASRADSTAAPIIDSLERGLQLTVNEAIIDTNVYLVPKSQWAAIVNGRDTVDFADLQALEDPYRRRYKIDNTTLELKQQMLREAARRYVLVQAARARSIDTLPDVIAEERSLRHQYQKVVFMLDSQDEEWMPSDTLIEEYYQAHLHEYDITKPLTVQHIVAADSSVAAFIRDQALAGMDFLELAEEYYPGEKAIRRDLADLGEIGPLDVSPAFYEAARVTAVGQISEPVKTQFGWHIIKVLEHRQPMTVSQARHQILPILKEEHRRNVFNAFRDRLYQRFNVTFPGRLYAFQFRTLRERETTVNTGEGESHTAGPNEG